MKKERKQWTIHCHSACPKTNLFEVMHHSCKNHKSTPVKTFGKEMCLKKKSFPNLWDLSRQSRPWRLGAVSQPVQIIWFISFIYRKSQNSWCIMNVCLEQLYFTRMKCDSLQFMYTQWQKDTCCSKSDRKFPWVNPAPLVRAQECISITECWILMIVL